jgi:hypothetical protein
LNVLHASSRFVIGLAAAGLLAGVSLTMYDGLRSSGPSSAGFAEGEPVPLPPGLALEQSFYLPACDARWIRLLLHERAVDAARVSVELLAAQQGSRPEWPRQVVVARSFSIRAGDTHVDLPIEPLAARAPNLFALRLALDDGGPVVLDGRIAPARWPGLLRRGSAWQSRRSLAFTIASGHAGDPLAPLCPAGGSAWRSWAAATGIGLVLLSVTCLWA